MGHAITMMLFGVNFRDRSRQPIVPDIFSAALDAMKVTSGMRTNVSKARVTPIHAEKFPTFAVCR